MQYDNDKLSDLYEKHSKNPFLGETINQNDTLVKAISKILLKLFGFGLIITIPLLLLFYIFIEILSIEPGILFIGLTIILYMYFILYLYYFTKKNIKKNMYIIQINQNLIRQEVCIDILHTMFLMIILKLLVGIKF